MSENTPPPAAGEQDLEDIDGRGLSHEDRLTAIEGRLRRGARRIVTLEAGMRENTKITTEVRDLLQLGRNGLRILGWLGTVAGWGMKVGVPLAALVHFFRDSGSGAPK